MWNAATNTGLAGHAAPYFFPFRALTVAGTPNVLTVGKTLAMTFAANTAAREHANEWRSGVAGGAAATLMVLHNWTTADVLANVAELQTLLATPAVDQPMRWSKPPPPPPPPRPPAPPAPRKPGTYGCGAGRCFEFHGSQPNPAYTSPNCSAATAVTAATAASGTTVSCPYPPCAESKDKPACPGLAASEWLLLKAHWRVAHAGNTATAQYDTVMKKSELPGATLPPSQKKPVAQGTVWRFGAELVSADHNYFLGADPTPTVDKITGEFKFKFLTW